MFKVQLSKLDIINNPCFTIKSEQPYINECLAPCGVKIARHFWPLGGRRMESTKKALVVAGFPVPRRMFTDALANTHQYAVVWSCESLADALRMLPDCDVVLVDWVLAEGAMDANVVSQLRSHMKAGARLFCAVDPNSFSETVRTTLKLAGANAVLCRDKVNDDTLASLMKDMP